MPSSRSISLWANYLKKNWVIYTTGFLFVLLCNFMQVLVTRNLGWIIDFFAEPTKQLPQILVGADRVETFHRLFLVLFFGRLVLTIGRWGWRITLARETHKSSRMMREKIWRSVRFLPKRSLDTQFSKGALMNAANSDVNQSRFLFGFTLVGTADMVFLGILTIGTMLSIHPLMTVWCFSFLLFLPIVVKFLSEREIVRYQSSQEALSDFNDLSSQSVATVRLQRLTQTGQTWMDKLLESAENFRQKRLNAILTSVLYIPTMGVASIVSYVILFLIGINYVKSGSLSIGDFMAMQGLVFLLQDPLMELGFIISDFQKGNTSLKRLVEIYDHPKEDYLIKDGHGIEKKKNNILSVKDLTFQHDGADEYLFENFNLNVDSGDRLGIVGPIGSGKSTLISILSGMERNIYGAVSFLDKNFNSYSHTELRKFIGQVPQKSFLFASTIKDNVAMDLDLSDEEVWHYLDLACVKEDVEQFEDGLYTFLGEWGINLSGGQKQRVTLARTLARKPEVLFLDDCMSAVDTVTEERILSNLNRELKETTIIWVAHRKSTLKYCNRILDMENGNIGK